MSAQRIYQDLRESTGFVGGYDAVNRFVRGDSGFCREEIMVWSEGQPEVDYCLGLAKNPVLIEQLEPALAEARARWCLTGAESVRVFGEFS